MAATTSKPRPHGLYLLSYVLDEIRAGRITPRQAFLLAHVDRWVNPAYPGPDGAEESVIFSTKYLRGILQADSDAVLQTVSTPRFFRHGHRNTLLVARKVGKWEWELKTRPRDRGIGNGHSALYIPPPVLTLFEEGQLRPMDVLVLSLVASFTRNKRPFYMSNRAMGERFGVTAGRIQQVMRRLIKRKLLKANYMTRDALRRMLGEQAWMIKGQLTARLLTPALPGLVRKDNEQEPLDDWDV